MLGREKCKYLREIRRRIAAENDIELITKECTFKGECKGTCPKCEAEVLYLEREIDKKKKLGEIVTIAGLSIASLISNTLLASCTGKTGDIVDDRNDVYGSDVYLREMAERETLHKNIVEYLNKEGRISSNEHSNTTYRFGFTVTKDGEIQNVIFYDAYSPGRDFIVSLLQSIPQEELNTLQSDWSYVVNYVVKWDNIEFSVGRKKIHEIEQE